MKRQKREFKTVEEYREYHREASKKWYQANREKKIKYQLDRYYNGKNNIKNQNEV